MKLVYRKINEWPKLAWVAKIANRSENILVYHGPMVETKDDWCAEAVWAGEFTEGHFDRTDLIFGTGIRCRDTQTLFVSSATTMDRLSYCHKDGVWYVSNSLAALLTIADLSLIDDYDYRKDLSTICSGLKNYTRTLPAEPADVQLAYFHNLIYDGQRVREVDKPDTAPCFRSFNDYSSFLFSTAESISLNMKAASRTHSIFPLASISSGYDSSAAAVIAKQTGCQQSATIRQSTSLWRGSDSGAEIAKQLDMSCKEYDRLSRVYPMEETIWAATGRAGILNWTQFDYPEPLCLMFTGCHGEKMWDRVCHDHPDPFVRRDEASLGFCEFRLFKGVFQCVVPFWGVRHSHELRDITLSDEMKSWCMNGDYDKPIVRRIVEDAGVPREMFGQTKKNTSTENPFLWPYSAEAKSSFETYLKNRGLYVPASSFLWLIRHAAQIDNFFYLNLKKLFRLKKKQRPWDRISSPSLLFIWANSKLKKIYEDGLASEGIKLSISSYPRTKQ